MAGNKKISQLSDASNLDGTEYFPIAKNGFNFKATVNMIRNFIGLASATSDGLMSKTDRSKLIAIAANATANSSDSTLLNRANHTGKQPISSISDAATVAKSGAYADLSGKPDLSPAGLNMAPAAHVTKGGISEHPLVTEALAGFMSPTHLQLIEAIRTVGFSAYYGDLRDQPLKSLITNGFTWNIDSDTTGGKSLNDWSTSGTATYVGLAATGTTYAANSAYHSFASAADTYSAAGMKSAEPVVKRGNHPIVGGFVFEAIWGPKTWVAGSVGMCGLFADASQSFGNFSGTDVGVGIGWTNSDVPAGKLRLMHGDGVSVQYTTSDNPDAPAFSTNTAYWVRMSCKPNGTQIIVDVIDVNTGVVLFDEYVIDTALPPPETPMYALAHVGTTSLSVAVSCNLWGMTATPYPSQFKRSDTE